MKFKNFYKKYFPTYLTFRLHLKFAAIAQRFGRFHFFFNAPVENIRYGIFGSTSNHTEKDPFLRVVKSIENKQVAFSLMANYYNNYQPICVSDVIGYSDNGPICNAPANLIQYLAPWNSNLANISDLGEEINRLYAQNTSTRKCLEYKIKVPVGNKQTQSIGPACENLIKCEYLRFLHTYQSFLNTGFINNHLGSGIIGCHILQKRDKRVFHIIDGLHRSAVLIVSGCRLLPISSRGSVINYDQLHLLPTVNRGLISLKMAQKFFDFIFDDQFSVKWS